MTFEFKVGQAFEVIDTKGAVLQSHIENGSVITIKKVAKDPLTGEPMGIYGERKKGETVPYLYASDIEDGYVELVELGLSLQEEAALVKISDIKDSPAVSEILEIPLSEPQPCVLGTGKHEIIGKFTIPFKEQFTVDLPKGAEIVRVESVDGIPSLWAVIDLNEQETETRYFEVYKTGGKMSQNKRIKHVGNIAIFVQMELMLYVFEVENHG